MIFCWERGVGWQNYGKTTPPSHFTFYLYSPTMRVSRPLSNCQTQTTAAAAGTGAIRPIETIKQVGQVFRRNAWAAVLYHDPRFACSALLYPYGYGISC